MTSNSPETGSNDVSTPERETHLRYNLRNGVVLEDFSAGHGEHRQRLLALRTPNGQQHSFREQLADKELILGRLVRELNNGITYYIVPRSSRPLAYDAGSSAEGSFTYGDKELFYDMGKLFADISQTTDGKVISEPIENSLALVEFVRPGERHLYAVPGIEQWLEPLDKLVDPLDYYVSMLKGSDLADQYTKVSDYFQSGYGEGLQAGSQL